MLQARMNYFILLQSRDVGHITRLALEDIKERSATSNMYAWLAGIIKAFDFFGCTSLLEQPILSCATKSIVKKLVNELWLVEHGASAAELEICTKYSRHLLELRDGNHILDRVQTVRMNVYAEPRCR